MVLAVPLFAATAGGAHRHRAAVSRCVVCDRTIINMGRGLGHDRDHEFPGAMFSTTEMMAGNEGPGDECPRCGRVFCTLDARDDAICPCGSTRFRTVRLRYR